MDEMKLENAQAAYEKLCESMDALNWKYTRDDNSLTIECSARGEDLPMDLVIRCDVEMQLLQLFSRLPFVVPEDKRLDFAIATTVVNNKMVYGCFDYNIADGAVFFRMANCFRGIELGFETIKYMILCSCSTIDDYNDKYLMVAKGMLSLEQFLESEA